MKYLIFIIGFTLTSAFYSCSTDVKKTKENTAKKDDNVKVSFINPNDKKTKELKLIGAKIAKVSTITLGKALTNAIENDGPEAAIEFCNHKAMSITDSISKANKVIIRRIAKKYRNPDNETNAMESKIFKQYIMEWIGGSTLESKIAVNNDGHPVFFKPIITTKNCLVCHGKPGETMPDNIVTKISELYPNDKAINFEDGHPRGMWSITFSDITVSKK